MTIHSLLTHGARRLVSAENAHPWRDAEELLAHMLATTREYLLAHPEEHVSPLTSACFDRMIDRRCRHEPLAYIVGVQDFFGRTFHVTRDVLIPRPETECLITATLAFIRSARYPHRIIDIGTGSGCVIISLAATLLQDGDRRHTFDAIDLSHAALHVGRRNARAHGVTRWVRFHEGSLLDPLLHELPHTQRPLLFVANLPYLSADDRMSPLCQQEPTLALDGGADGLDVYRSLFLTLQHFAVPWTLFAEIDPRQERRLADDLVPSLFPDRAARILHDYNNRARILHIGS